MYIYLMYVYLIGLPLWLSWLRICLQCQRPGLDPWVGKIPWRRERLPTPEFRPREFHGLYSPWYRKKSDMTEGLSFSLQRVQWSSVLWLGSNGSCAQSELKVCLYVHTIHLTHCWCHCHWLELRSSQQESTAHSLGLSQHYCQFFKR